MTRFISRSLATVAAALLAALPLVAADMPISVVQFPERSSVDLKMAATARVAPAEAEASVKFKDGQASVEVESKKLPPAILFGGDATSYVVWAISRDGNAENLGELIVLDSSGTGQYRTGQKEFALMVTAEPYHLVLKPSDLVCFTSITPAPKKAKSTPITFSGFVAAPKIGNQQIGSMKYSGGQPVELVQAQRVLDQARAMGAEKYAPDSIRDAGITLAQAENSYKGGSRKVGMDYARRSLSLSSTAIRDTQKNLAQEAATAAAAKRAAEMQALEQGKAQAQQQQAAAEQQTLAAREAAVAAREQTVAAQQQLAQSQQQLDQARQQAAAAQQQMSTLQQQAAVAQLDAAVAQQKAAVAGLSAEQADAARRDADDARRKAEALAAQATAARTEAERTTAEVATVAASLEAKNTELKQENEDGARRRRQPARHPFRRQQGDAQAEHAGRAREARGHRPGVSEDQLEDRGLHGFNRFRRAQHAAFQGPLRGRDGLPEVAGRGRGPHDLRRLRPEVPGRRQRHAGRAREEPPRRDRSGRGRDPGGGKLTDEA
jgi:hypothetical protein